MQKKHLSGFIPQNCVAGHVPQSSTARHVPQSSTAGYALKRKPEGFTLVELLISIGILSVLATAAVIVVDPAELLKQARDATRVSDLQTVNKALALYEADGNMDFGVANTIYVSLPDTQADCSSHTLPPLPGGWSYACKPEATYQDIDGNGWIPVDLTSISAGSPLAVLPVDPINSVDGEQYYTYVAGSWVLTGTLESRKQIATVGHSDGGTDLGRIEVGSHLSKWAEARGLVGYWSFDEGSGVSASDISENGHGATLHNGAAWVEGKIGSAVSFDGSNDWVELAGDFGISGSMTISLWFNTPSKTTNRYFLDDRNPGSWWFIKNYTGGACGEIAGNICFEGRVMAADSDWNVDEWTHLVVSENSSGAKMYINGALVDTGSGDNTSITTNLRIGTRYTNSGYFNGVIDEVRLYDRVLSDSEILRLYESAL
jgi:prepilin-type N-terminal cleavage/methylation domain-containing protein